MSGGLPEHGLIDRTGLDIYERFHSVVVTDEGREIIEALQDELADMAMFILDHSDRSREQATALTHLEAASMWATKAIAQANREDD